MGLGRVQWRPYHRLKSLARVLCDLHVSESRGGWEAEDRNLGLGLRLISGAKEAHGPHVCAVQSPHKAHPQLLRTRAFRVKRRGIRL
jgi:hypothetical protein